MVTGHLVPRLSDSIKTFAFLSQARRLESGLWNLMLPSVRLLSTWQPMHTCVVFCFSAQGVDTVKNFLNSFSPIGIDVVSNTICCVDCCLAYEELKMVHL